MLFRVSGRRGAAIFDGEAGGHRWQRVPPTEKRGRVHTSTITVAVLEEPGPGTVRIDHKDLDETFTRGSGAGGQHRNKNSTAVRLHHRPSGIRVRVDGGRSQHRNRETALAILTARLASARQEKHIGRANAARQRQVGTGRRGDKIRTVRVQAGEVVDHRRGKRVTFKRYRRGDFGELLD